MGAYSCNVEDNIEMVCQNHNIFIFGSSLFCNISSAFLTLHLLSKREFSEALY